MYMYCHAMHAEESASKYHTMVKPIYQYTLHRHIRVRPAYINVHFLHRSFIEFLALLVIFSCSLFPASFVFRGSPLLSSNVHTT